MFRAKEDYQRLEHLEEHVLLFRAREKISTLRPLRRECFIV
jgi:hypothetical protein